MMKLDAVEFLRRFLQRVLPDRFVRIRHYGFLANRAREQELPLCRRLIARATSNGMMTASALEAPADVGERCPACRQGNHAAHPGRSLTAWVPADIIGDYQGYVQTDGYRGYERPCSRPGIVHVGCWAHVRRAFKDAADAQYKVSSRAGTAHQALAYIAKLYRIESELSDYREPDPDRFLAERRARAQPVLDKMHGWLRQKQNQLPPSMALGKAIAFALGQWPKLIRYLDHAQLTPDNNSCEQAIRPFVIGRKNWLFSGSPRGAAASALLYSLIETAKANGCEPYSYLRELFEKLPLARTRADYLALLPTARPPPSPP